MAITQHEIDMDFHEMDNVKLLQNHRICKGMVNRGAEVSHKTGATVMESHTKHIVPCKASCSGLDSLAVEWSSSNVDNCSMNTILSDPPRGLETSDI